MALRKRAVLELEVEDRTGEFHMLHPSETGELNREYLMGDRGQMIREAIDILEDDAGGQEGWSLDVGQGQDQIQLQFEAGHDPDPHDGIPLQWGDGSSGIDRWDATGAHPQTMMQVFRWWCRHARADSFRSQALLHWGEWTDGSIDGVEGIFGEPIPVKINSVRLERGTDAPSSFTPTVEMERTKAGIDPDDENNPLSVPDF